MSRKRKTIRPLTPNHETRLKTLDDLGSPTFHGLACTTCGAPEGYECLNVHGSQYAHQSRIDAALWVAYGQEP